MQLVEQHIIDRTDPCFAVIDQAAFASKNLYNAALYLVRQSHIFEGKYLNYPKMDKLMKSHEAYQALPAKVAQQVLKQVDHDWDAFFQAIKAYKQDPSRFRARPKIPKYKDKAKGRNLLVYTLQALEGGQSKKGIAGLVKPSGLPITVKTRQQHISQVRIVPRKGFYVLEVVYEHAQPKSAVDPASYAGIDIGLDNLAALTSNQPGFVPVLVNGRPMKSINHYDRDPMPVYDPNRKEQPTFRGKRIHRGLYRAADGTLINADWNGASNIIRKVAPDAFGSEGVEDGKGHKPVVHPVRIVVDPLTKPKREILACKKMLSNARDR